MAQLSPPTNASRPELSEREALIALISRLSLASADVEARITRLSAVASDMTSLATEVQAKVALLLPPLAPPPPDPDTLWVAGVPKTPTELEDEIPAGSGEVWYVVIRGREPGLYRTYDEANAMTNGVPNQWQQKKKSRREAIAWYRDHYVAARNAVNTIPVPGAPPVGVQKWVAVV
ncbi:hypothetical protein C8R44DRAFT_863387 [Mycena epipterygia]|nr:hypothetical protein C8R44DRAFT_892174 [Mycena epipterygia]KAJ7145513.1 hypothetical protein C8R44DRAFT_863387 [Mycena epipterygia]